MQMKKFIVVLAAGLVLFGAMAQTALAAIEVEGDVYASYNDKYLWRGFDLSASKHVLQPGVDIYIGNFTIGYWSNLDLDSGELNETDITLDYSLDLGDMVSVSVGNIFYAVEDIEDTNEAYVACSLNTLLAPTLEIYYDYDEAESDGLFFVASVGHTFEVSDSIGINLGALVSYNQASDFSIYYEDANGDAVSYRDWHNYELSASADFAVTEQITITPAFIYSEGISDEARRAIDSETLGGITVNFTF